MSSTPETTTPPQSRELEANQTPDLQPQDIHPRSLRELVDYVSGKHLRGTYIEGESGVADLPMFPFLALVGQREMKLALLLSLINPALGGVLLMGPRGTGKTTAARSLSDLLPDVPRSLCHYGCLPEDIETGGIDAVCTDCAEKYAMGDSIAVMDKVLLIELPLNARLEDVVGTLDERAAASGFFRVRRGILSQADRNLLYVDEVNLLPDEIVDAILDASAQGRYTVRRGAIASTYNSRFVLIGSMNPEEGNLRSQIMDRFGLRLIVQGLDDLGERLEAYRRVQAYQRSPLQMANAYQTVTELARDEIQTARSLLTDVQLPDTIAQMGLELVRQLQIDSLRAEITMFEAARAHAAADNRLEVTMDDLRQVAPMALRLRRSDFMAQYFNHQKQEETHIESILDQVLKS
ncbi:MAG TPA: ATP-binding protein [Anaerolineales bacterium]|nr:ATP-binding protein [Anaerolineales bacterium]